MPAKKRKEQDDLEQEEYIERKISATERIADSNERLADTAVEAGKHRLRMCSVTTWLVGNAWLSRRA